jgi:hypothetical protein
MAQVQPELLSVDSSIDRFEHTPLDLHLASIRLIQLRTTQNIIDQIECDIVPTTVDDQYTCLSYVWGTENSGQWILINGKRFWVRQNLWNFLHTARHNSKLTSRQFWIDALCIDQENTSERQHQVQQMGRIYSEATDVISWLGNEKDIARFLKTSEKEHAFIIDDMSFYRSPYWGRAWITQEIVLGYHVWLMACDQMTSLDELLSKSKFYAGRGPYFSRDLGGRLSYMRDLRQARRPNAALHDLLNRFKSQKCHVRRDRIFSLLALCNLNTIIDVDYSSADIDVAINVLKSCQNGLCLCFIDLIATTLGEPSPDKRSYVFGPGQILAYGAVTIPIVKTTNDDFDNIHILQSSCKNGTSTQCQDIAPSKVEVFQSARKRITLNLNQLCSTYCGWIVLWIDPGKSEFSYRYIGSYGGGKLMIQSNTARAINLQTIHHGRNCKVNLSLDLWVWLATVSERHARRSEDGLGLFCDRVHRQKTQPPHEPGGLKLYLDVRGESVNADIES